MGFTRRQVRKPFTQIGVRKIAREQAVHEEPRPWRDLAHPELHVLTDPQFAARSDWLSAVVNQVPQADRVYWYGGMRRTWKGGDGGNGAWMTESQAAAWKDRTDMGTVVAGPS